MLPTGSGMSRKRGKVRTWRELAVVDRVLRAVSGLCILPVQGARRRIWNQCGVLDGWGHEMGGSIAHTIEEN